MRLELEQFCAVNSLDREQFNDLLSRNGINEDDVLVIDFAQFMPAHQKFFSPYIDPPTYLRQVNNFIKKNQNIYMPKYMIFFHSTARILKDKILSEGLLPTSNKRRRSYQSTNGYVCLAANREKAETFGKMANGYDTCTFAVLVKTTDIRMDMDQLRNKKSAQWGYEEEIKETLADSIWYGGGVRVKGMIQPYQLVLLKETIFE